jgi:sulfur carrier protein ThiS
LAAVKVQLIGHIAQYLSLERADVEVDSGTPVTIILSMLGIDPRLVALVIINGGRADLEALAQPGDTVALISPVLGG